MMIGHGVHRALGVGEVTLPLQFHTLHLDLRRFQIQLRAQAIDRRFENLERSAVYREMSANLTIASVHRSVDGNLSGEVARVGAKQTGKITEITDGSRHVAAKIWPEPIR